MGYLELDSLWFKSKTTNISNKTMIDTLSENRGLPASHKEGGQEKLDFDRQRVSSSLLREYNIYWIQLL